MMKPYRFHFFTLLILALSALSLSAHDFEVDGIYYNINGSEATVTYAGENPYESEKYYGDVTIPETVTFGGITYPVTSIGAYAFYYCGALTSVKINNSVTEIGESAFYCSGLTNITIPNSVTSIGNSAFSDCYALANVSIPNSVTSIGDYAFYNCFVLTSVTIPDSVTSIGNYAFSYCYSLVRIAIPNSVNSIGVGTFSGCSGLTNMSVDSENPKFDSRDNCNAIIETATNTLIAGCQNTIIPNTVTSIYYFAFYDCNSLTSITIPNSVVYIGFAAFSGCSGLTSVTIPNSVTTIENETFFGCSGLTSITIPNSVTSIGGLAFIGCSGLTGITIPNSVTYISPAAFWECSGLASISVDSENPKYDSRNNCNAIIETATNTLIFGCKNTIIPNSVTILGSYAFYGCSSLTCVVIPNSVTSIGNYAFFGCSGLTSVTIPNSVTDIGNDVFRGCESLTSVTCLALTPPTIDQYTFSSEVTNRAKLYVPMESVADYQAADYWKEFSRIIGLSSVNDFEVDGIWYCALTDSTATVIRNPNEEEYYQGDVVIPDMVTYQGAPFTVVAIDEGAFEDCFELSGVVIGDAVETIGENAFQGCSDLTSLTIGCGVTSIGAKAFNYCNALQTVTCRGKVPPVMASSNCFSNATYSRAVLMVPRQQIEAYQVADYWYKFNKIEGWGSSGKGDVNADGNVSISDVTTLINALLTSDTNPIILEYGDMNSTGGIDIGDVTTLIYLLLMQ